MKNAVNFKDLILTEDQLDPQEEVDTTTGTIKKVSVRKINGPTFTQIVGSGIDFAIKKTTKTSDLMLVVLVSQNQYYVKDNKKGTISKLDTDILSKFFAGNTSDNENSLQELEGVSWIKYPPHGITAYRYFIDVLNKIPTELFKKGVIYVNPNEDVVVYKTDRWGNTFNSYFDNMIEQYNTSLTKNPTEHSNTSFNRFDVLIEIKKCLETYTKQNPDCEVCNWSPVTLAEKIRIAWKNSYSYYVDISGDMIQGKIKAILKGCDIMSYIYENYGLDNVKDFIMTYLDLPDIVNIERKRGYYGGYAAKGDIFNGYTFAYPEFRDYLLHESIRQGYANDLQGITRDWLDCLDMQVQIFNEVQDKYPENLATMHNRLAYIKRRNEEAYDEIKMAEVANKIAALECEFQKDGVSYIVKTPKNRTDFVNEASMQSNCVAGYFKKVLEESCIVAFLRKKKTENKSWITLEIRKDKNGVNRIVQAKACYNRTPDSEAKDAIKAYCKKMELELALSAY